MKVGQGGIEELAEKVKAAVSRAVPALCCCGRRRRAVLVATTAGCGGWLPISSGRLLAQALPAARAGSRQYRHATPRRAACV